MQFAPGESKTAIAPIRAKPSGMACEAELFLDPDDKTKVATSGRVPFISTGVSQNVRLPVAMPSAEGTYHVYIDVFTEGIRFLAYQSVEDVVIVAVADIRVENLVVSPAEVYVGEKVTISVRATNYGGAVGSKKIVCTVT